MASSEGSRGAKRIKIEEKAAAAAAVGEDPSSDAPTISTPPLPTRYPPFHRSVPGKAPWELRISKLSKKDPRRDLPTVMRPWDILTARDVISSRDKAVVRDVARSVVSVISVSTHQLHFSGFVVSWNQTRKCARILTGFNTISISNPKPKLQVCLPNKSILEAKLLFFNGHYDIALLEISSESELPLQLPSFGSNPNYGQDVFVLGRDDKSLLTARRGTIKWLEETDYLGRHCNMFLSCEPPLFGNGGPVIDLDGNVIGMAFVDFISNSPMLAIPTILTCMEMWMKFSCIPRPIHGLRLRTVELLNVSLQEMLSLDHNINSGYIVDEVSVGSIAERLGVKSGEVIISFDGLHDYTLPQLEDYFLSLGGRFLRRGADSSFIVDVKLEVYDLLEHSTRTIILPIGFSVAPETEEEKEEEEEEKEEEEEEEKEDKKDVEEEEKSHT